MNYSLIGAVLGFLVSAGSMCHVQCQSGFILLMNESVPCVELSRQQPKLQRVELTDSDKLQMMALKNIQLMTTFTAITQEDALNNFPSLLPLEYKYIDHIAQQLTKPGPDPHKITKKDITDYMINLYSGKLLSTRSDKSRKEHSDEEQNNDETSSNTDYESHQQDNFRSFLEELEDVKDVEKRMSRWRKWMKQTFGEEDASFPLYFPEMLGIPRKYTQPAGRSVEIQFCQSRGDLTQDVHVRLCTVCSATITNPEGTWPPYMNGAQCTIDDSECLFVDQFAHGTCRQVTAPINMLKKRNELCTLIMKDGQTLIADHWDVITEVVNVGCECNIKPGSFFEEFA